MARALRFQLHDRLAATVASPRIRSGRGRPLCSGWVIPRCPRERRRSESNRRIEVLQTSALPLGYGAELLIRQLISMLFRASAADLSKPLPRRLATSPEG